jgi:hypothetical protein
VALLLIVFSVAAATTPRHHLVQADAAPPTAHGQGAGTPLIALALHGDIYTMQADGTGRHRLTTSGRASMPRLSPNGRLVAYFMAAPDQPAQGNPKGAVYVRQVEGPTGAPAQPLDHTPITRDEADLSWSPDSSRLAYFHESMLVIHPIQGHGADTLLHAPPGDIYAGDVAWSPDSHRIAVPLSSPSQQTFPRTLSALVGTPAGTRRQRITIRLPSGALGSRAGNFPVSVPSHDLIWTADGHGFLFSTALAGEGPPDITGLWQVGSGGGTARPVIGTTDKTRTGKLPADSGLAQATHFLIAPNRTRLAADPSDTLWVATPTGHGGKFLPVRVSRLCVLAQFVWLSDGSGLAYVQVCPIDQDGLAEVMLFSVRLDGSPPRQLYRVASTNQQVVELGPSYRCVLCGY